MMDALTKESDALDAEISALITDYSASAAMRSKKTDTESRSKDTQKNVSKPALVEEKSNSTRKHKKYGPSTGVNHTKEQTLQIQTHRSAQHNTMAKPEKLNVSDGLLP